MTDYTIVLSRKFPNSSWCMNADDYDQLVWLSDTPKPTKAELDALWLDVKKDAEAGYSARETAIAKLVALGLSEAEIKALLG